MNYPVSSKYKKLAVLGLGVAMACLLSLTNAYAGNEKPPVVHPITGQEPVNTYIVTKTTDSGDNNNPGNGTLRKALVDANKSSGFDLIRFDIPGSGVKTITVVNYFPSITDNAGVMIDGTQSDDQIEIDGSQTSGHHGIHITSNNNVIKGITVNGVTGAAGIAIERGSNNLIIGTRVGTNSAGTAAKPNHSAIMLSSANNNTIGGTSGVTPGGACTGDCNLFSGNLFHGIVVDKSNNNRIIGNFIGLNRNGTGSIANGQDGVLIGDGHNNTVGGPTPQERNVISGNKVVGVEVGLANAYQNLIQGNFIGTNSAGNAGVANSGAGVLVVVSAHDNVIDGNVVSGHSKFGILVFKDAIRTEIKNNRVGMAAGSDARIGNGKQGIEVQTNGNSIHHNRVAFSNNDGIRVKAGMNNLMSQNSTFENGTFGMNLGTDAFTENDNGDGDNGPNGYQNFPIISSASSSNGTLMVKGNLNSRPNARYTIEIFNNPACDSVFGNAVGEGKTFLGTTQVTTNSSGNANFTIQVNGSFGGVVTGTATDGQNNTSELSYCKSITASSKPGKPELVSPDNGGTTDNPPALQWQPAANADHYQVVIRADGPKGAKAHQNKNVEGTFYRPPNLPGGKTYWWRVSACTEDKQCTKSEFFTFTIP